MSHAFIPQFPRIAHRVLNTLFPPHCPVCTTAVHEAHSLCATCWDRLHFLGVPECYQCGIPFDLLDHEVERHAQHLCGSCLKSPPVYQAHRAILTYDTHSKRLILPFKHADRMDLARLMAPWLRRRLSDLPVQPDLLVPVPLHRWRLLHRRYNQAALLAAQLTRDTGLPHDPCLLTRRRNTISQGGLSPNKRWKNVHGAFDLDQPEKVEGRHILLIDDVFTTGATLNECAATLLSAGVASVCALTVARVVKPSHHS